MREKIEGLFQLLVVSSVAVLVGVLILGGALLFVVNGLIARGPDHIVPLSCYNSVHAMSRLSEANVPRATREAGEDRASLLGVLSSREGEPTRLLQAVWSLQPPPNRALSLVQESSARAFLASSQEDGRMLGMDRGDGDRLRSLARRRQADESASVFAESLDAGSGGFFRLPPLRQSAVRSTRSSFYLGQPGESDRQRSEGAESSSTNDSVSTGSSVLGGEYLSAEEDAPLSSVSRGAPTPDQTCRVRNHNGQLVRSAARRVKFLKEVMHIADGKVPKGFFVDHIIPLYCNSCDVPSNMELLSEAEWRAKSRWERQPCSSWSDGTYIRLLQKALDEQKESK